MRTLATNTLPTGVRRLPPRRRTFIRAIIALLVAATAVAATALIMWQGATSHSNPLLARVVGPDTFVESVYDEQVPPAANTQQPPYLPAGNAETNSNPAQTGNVIHTQQPPYLPMGNAETDVRELDDDSAALTADQQRAQK